MSFVKKKIRIEDARALAEKFNFKPLCVDSSIQVNENTEISLICFGGQGGSPKQRGEPPTYFGMYWHEGGVLFSAYYSSKKSELGDYGLIFDICIVKQFGLIPESDQLECDLKDALAAQWKADFNIDFNVSLTITRA
jgi:hypothetical protein